MQYALNCNKQNTMFMNFALNRSVINTLLVMWRGLHNLNYILALDSAVVWCVEEVINGTQS